MIVYVVGADLDRSRRRRRARPPYCVRHIACVNTATGAPLGGAVLGLAVK